MPREFTQTGQSLRDLADKMAPKWRARFLAVVEQLKGTNTLKRIEELIASGLVADALVLLEAAALQLGRLWGETFVVAADATAGLVSDALNITLNYDTVNERALREISQNQLRMVREFSQKQREATQVALRHGVERGLNPRDMARQFRGSIGLTARQVRAVENYRRMLEGRHPRLSIRAGLREAKRRMLRDRRWDPAMDRAIDSGRPLPQVQIDKMVDRYRQRYVKYRSEVIARTESLRAVHAGSGEMYQQAFDSGLLRVDSLVKTWDHSKDSRVRPSHRVMDGQQRPVGQPFITGRNNAMMYPGDPSAPPEDSVQDRCAVTTRYREPLV